MMRDRSVCAVAPDQPLHGYERRRIVLPVPGDVNVGTSAASDLLIRCLRYDAYHRVPWLVVLRWSEAYAASERGAVRPILARERFRDDDDFGVEIVLVEVAAWRSRIPSV
jgi:hypothetical protein